MEIWELWLGDLHALESRRKRSSTRSFERIYGTLNLSAKKRECLGRSLEFFELEKENTWNKLHSEGFGTNFLTERTSNKN